MLSKKRKKTRVLIRLHGCAGWYVPLLFAYGITPVFSWRGSYFICKQYFQMLLDFEWGIINWGSYMSGHFVWSLWNEPSASFINFILNDHECKILFIIWLFKLDFIILKVAIISTENATLSRMSLWRYMFALKCSVTCGHMIFMTWRYPLNNSDVIW